MRTARGVIKIKNNRVFAFWFFLVFSVMLSLNDLFIYNAFASSLTEDVSILDSQISEEKTFPSYMKGVYITPVKDYVSIKEDGSGYTESELYDQINLMLDRITGMSLNTILIECDYDGIMLADTENKSIIDYTAEIALSRGFYVYLSIDLSIFGNSEGISTAEIIDNISETVEKILINSNADGVIIKGKLSDVFSDYSMYMKYGSGIGYDNWLSQIDRYTYRVLSDRIGKLNSRIPFGIYTDGNDGMDEFLTYADFIMLMNSNGIEYEFNSFGSVAEKYIGISKENNCRLFILHQNDYTSTGTNGWNSPEELVRQLMLTENSDNCGGDAFASFSALCRNIDQSTDLIRKYYTNDLDVENLGEELTFFLPEQTEYRTEDTEVIFAGEFDPNFDIYLDDKKIELNEAKSFYFSIPLEIGENVFTFREKDKSVTFRITRTIKVMKTAQPRGEAIYADEGTHIFLSATAYKGSAVMAYINREKVYLTESSSAVDGIDPNSSYTEYTGYYLVPKASEYEMQDLGDIKIYAAYPTENDNILECITGSRLYVNKKELPPVTETTENINTDGTEKAEEVNASSGIISINKDNTMCWRADNTTTVPEPYFSRLPMGTLDFVRKTVTYNGTSFYITESGRRIRTSDASKTDVQLSSEGRISVNKCGLSNNDTVMLFDISDKVPFTVSYGGITDRADHKIPSFDSEYINIVFSYIKDIPTEKVNFGENSVFSYGEWTSSGKNAVLRLYLSKRGVFDGIRSYYNTDGQLVMIFNDTNKTISGATIVIDPGHGYTGGKFDPGAVRYIKEQTANYKISLLLEEELRNRGANVIRFRTESEDYLTSQRAETARKYDPDLFIALHCNSGNENSKGAEAYYFTPFSQPLAAAVSKTLGAVLSDVHGGGNFDRGSFYNYFFVTQQEEFPSILCEMGFVSNYDEAMALYDNEYQRKFALAIADGIENYFASQ